LQSAKFVAFGSNANTNGLLRRYILKGTDLSMRSHAYVGVSTMESGRFDDASSLSGVREMIAVIFELWPAPEKMQTYLDMGARLGPQLEKMDGFISIERFQSFMDPGKLLVLSIWRDEAAVGAFRNWEIHRGVQPQGCVPGLSRACGSRFA
jgi:heme-degrading monooxygenase HmoA